MLLLVCGFKHRLSGNHNCSMKLKACEMVFVTGTSGKWVVYPVKLFSHENLLGLVWKKSVVPLGVALVSEEMRLGSVWKLGCGNAHP